MAGDVKKYFWICLGLMAPTAVILLLLKLHWAYVLMLLGCGISLLTVTTFTIHSGRRVPPTLPYGRNDGARQDLSDLAWAFSAKEEVSPYARGRLEAVLTSLNLPIPAVKTMKYPEFAAALEVIEAELEKLEGNPR